MNILCLLTKLQEILVEKKSAVLDFGKELVVSCGLRCTHSYLSKFKSSEDFNYLRVKATIANSIDSITTRRLWAAISAKNATPSERAAEVKLQISKGADVNRRNPQKQNVLHLAIEAGDIDIVKLLLQTSVEVNAKDIDHRSPITLALE